jgi:hypothetical protein
MSKPCAHYRKPGSFHALAKNHPSIAVRDVLLLARGRLIYERFWRAAHLEVAVKPGRSSDG